MRLSRGRFDSVVTYEGSPDEVARQYLLRGARRLHVIALWGARDGRIGPDEQSAIARIVSVRNSYGAQRCSIQVGGGIRRYQQAATLFGMGIDYIIVGTCFLLPLALEAGFVLSDIKRFYQQVGKPFDSETEMPEVELIDRFSPEERNRIIIAVDYRGEEIGLSGWEVLLPLRPAYVISRFFEKGFSRFLLTDIERDGTLGGINEGLLFPLLAGTANLSPSPELIVSGGIHSENDLETLARAPRPPDGAVIGKALYHAKVDLRRAIQRFQERQPA